MPTQDRSEFTSVRLKSHFVAWAKAEAALRGMYIYDFLEQMAAQVLAASVPAYRGPGVSRRRKGGAK